MPIQTTPPTIERLMTALEKLGKEIEIILENNRNYRNCDECECEQCCKNSEKTSCTNCMCSA